MVGTHAEKKLVDEIAAHLRTVNEKIARACDRAGRQRVDVKLLAVSKTKPLEIIKAAFSAGQGSFGENYVQEAVEKVASFPDADWHFIGSLQSNKAKAVVGRFSLIHSVDRAKLADELAKAASSAGVIQDVLVQIRIGDEATKHGVTIEEAPALIDYIRAHENLRLRGVMSLPPLSNDERVTRGYFSRIRAAFEIWKLSEQDFDELSLGTSSDYEWAILEGATIVRVGTAIFGERE